MEGFAREDLVEALAAGKVVRGLLMRATLHTVSAKDYRAFRPAVQPVLSAAYAGVDKRRREGVDVDAVLPAARKLLEQEPRTFNALRAALSEQFPDANERGLGYAARTHLPLTMVPSDDRWGFPRDARFELAKANKAAKPATLVRRYLAAFGPASAADVQTWSGLRALGDVLEGMDDLERFDGSKGRTLYDLPDAPAPVRFLPEFDNLVLAHADRTRLLDEQHRPRVVTKNLRVKATFLIDGRVAGTWKSERKGKKATLTLEPFGKLRKKDVAALQREGEALLRFVEEDAGSYDLRV